jgi:hypothetical protein
VSKKEKKGKTAVVETPQQQPSRPRRNWLRTVFFVLGLAAVGGLVIQGKTLSEMWAVYWINQNIDQFRVEAKPVEKGSAPYLRGKLLPIDKETWRVSSLYHDLPDSLRPDSAQEVGTLALLEWTSETKEGKDKPFTRRTCKVTLIDLDKKKEIDVRSFSTAGADVSDKVAQQPVLDFLSHLPGTGRKTSP